MQRVVSIHAPARGATLRTGKPIHDQLVSIHAPARGATLLHIGLPDVVAVSIHAPARGATKDEVLRIVAALFQSTPPRGGRRRH